MSELTEGQRIRIIRRRGNICDACGKRKWTSNLEVHHKDRNRNNNASTNLRVLCEECHDELHRRAGY